jgi:hypothetical protein
MRRRGSVPLHVAVAKDGGSKNENQGYDLMANYISLYHDRYSSGFTLGLHSHASIWTYTYILLSHLFWFTDFVGLIVVCNSIKLVGLGKWALLTSVARWRKGKDASTG